MYKRAELEVALRAIGDMSEVKVSRRGGKWHIDVYPAGFTEMMKSAPNRNYRPKPTPRSEGRTALYEILYGDMVRIGTTDNPHRRRKQHMREDTDYGRALKEGWGELRVIKWYDKRIDAEFIEKRVIRTIPKSRRGNKTEG